MNIIKDKIFVVDNFIFPETCDFLIKHFSDNLVETTKAGILAGPNSDLSTGAELVSGMHKVDSPANDLAVDLMTSLCTNIEKTVSMIFNRNLSFRSYFYSHMIIGGKNPPHVDNKLYENDVSAILYLSNDYEGGVINFKKLEVELKPTAGTLITFIGDKNLGHEVKEVISGNRINIVCFLKERENENQNN